MSALAAVRPAVGPVEAAPFERYADVAENLSQRASARRALSQSIVLERLGDFEVLAAALAGVLVRWHDEAALSLALLRRHC